MSNMIRFEDSAPSAIHLITRVGMYVAVLIAMTFVLVAVAAPSNLLLP